MSNSVQSNSNYAVGDSDITNNNILDSSNLMKMSERIDSHGLFNELHNVIPGKLVKKPFPHEERRDQVYDKRQDTSRLPLIQISYRRLNPIPYKTLYRNERYHNDISNGKYDEYNIGADFSQNWKVRSNKEKLKKANTSYRAHPRLTYNTYYLFKFLPLLEDIPIYYRRLLFNEYMKHLTKRQLTKR